MYLPDENDGIFSAKIVQGKDDNYYMMCLNIQEDYKFYQLFPAKFILNG